ncbi:MAG: two-component sensor histidine kinase [Acidimicrobiales bacterium]|nr:two-component sensor histidine kinase [Acidimicrobiales bacterium]RZV47658.1 MAG: two-component sensor histidine kinase [Acidimicrobiales bacterium]
MWLVLFLASFSVLLLIVVLSHQREQRVLEKLRGTLQLAGDTRGTPRSVNAAIDRLDDLVLSDETDEFERRMSAAFDVMNAGAVVVDADGEELLRNRLAQPYATGRHGDALVESVIQDRLEEALRGELTDEELRLHGPPEKVLLIVGAPVIEGGELLGAVVLVDDISEQRRLDKMRRDFVANVSHELRTPVGAISVLAETLEGEHDPQILADFNSRIRVEALRLARLIEDLLDLGSIEDGVGEDLIPVAASAIVEAAAAVVQHAAEQRDVTIDLKLDDVAPVLGNKAQLVSAVSNLLSNAIKYSSEGSTVSGRVVAHGDQVAIVVEDNGIGIPATDHGRVFERFYRVDRGRSAETGGTGLGLSIVRNAVVNHGGRVELTSQEGVGSTFSIILPILGSQDEAGADSMVEPLFDD